MKLAGCGPWLPHILDTSPVLCQGVLIPERGDQQVLYALVQGSYISHGRAWSFLGIISGSDYWPS